MKKLLYFLFFTLLLINPNLSRAEDILQKLQKNLEINLAHKNIKGDQIKVEKIADIKEVENFILVRVKINLPSKTITDFFITNGDIVAENFIKLSTGENIYNKYMASYFKDNFDFSHLTHLKGNSREKNYFIEITDFQCPFCKKAFFFLKDRVDKKKDTDIYFLHYPLSTHKKSLLLAKIFEAGLKVNKNFAEELFSKDWDKQKDEEIIDYFSGLSGAKEKFKQLVASKQIEEKIQKQRELAEKFGFTATPTFIYNGRIIRGFNARSLANIFGY